MALQKAGVWRLVAGGQLMRAAIEAAGYDFIPMCPSCEKDQDTSFHLVWECQSLEVAEASAKLAGRRLKGSSHPCVRHCLLFARVILAQPRMVSRPGGLNREVVQKEKCRLLGSSMQRGGGSD